MIKLFSPGSVSTPLLFESAGGPFRGERMRLVLSAAFVSLTLTPAVAADLFGSAPPMTSPASQAPTAVEIGTNWYLRGDIGVGFDDAPSVTLASVPSVPSGLLASAPASGGSGAGFAGDLGFGYRFTDFLRMDATWDLLDEPVPHALLRGRLPLRPPGRRKPGHRGCGRISLRYNRHLRRDDEPQPAQQHVPGDRICRSRNLCRVHPLCRRRRWPQHELHAGKFQFRRERERPRLCSEPHEPRRGFPSVWVNSAGQPISPQPNIPFTQQNWNRTINSTTYRFAWSLAAGVGFQISPSATLDIGYRYINGGRVQPARQSADRANGKAAQRLPAGPRRPPLRPAVGERVRAA